MVLWFTFCCYKVLRYFVVTLSHPANHR